MSGKHKQHGNGTSKGSPVSGGEVPVAPKGAWWNNLARKWLVSGPQGPVPLDPQPPPPPHVEVMTIRVSNVPPAVKVAL